MDEKEKREELKIYREPYTWNKGKPTSYIWVAELGDFVFSAKTFKALLEDITEIIDYDVDEEEFEI